MVKYARAVVGREERDFMERPLTEREMRVKLALLSEFCYAADELAATLRAIEIIAGMEATGVPVDSQFREVA